MPARVAQSCIAGEGELHRLWNAAIQYGGRTPYMGAEQLEYG